MPATNSVVKICSYNPTKENTKRKINFITSVTIYPTVKLIQTTTPIR